MRNSPGLGNKHRVTIQGQVHGSQRQKGHINRQSQGEREAQDQARGQSAESKPEKAQGEPKGRVN